MILDFSDEQLTESLDIVFSSFLKHNNYDSKAFKGLFSALQQQLSLEDMRGGYYVLYFILDRYNYLSSIFKDNDVLIIIDEEAISTACENNIPYRAEERRVGKGWISQLR